MYLNIFTRGPNAHGISIEVQRYLSLEEVSRLIKATEIAFGVTNLHYKYLGSPYKVINPRYLPLIREIYKSL